MSVVGGPVTKLASICVELQDNQLRSAEHLLGAMHLRKSRELTNGSKTAPHALEHSSLLFGYQSSGQMPVPSAQPALQSGSFLMVDILLKTSAIVHSSAETPCGGRPPTICPAVCRCRRPVGDNTTPVSSEQSAVYKVATTLFLAPVSSG